MKILDDIIEAHGGALYWNSIGSLHAEISASGFLFTAKRQRVLNHVRIQASVREPLFRFLDFPQPGQTAHLIGSSEVRITDISGTIVAQRLNPREAFKEIRRQFYWDVLDFIYFAGYATWNYLTAPFLFMREGFIIRELDPAPGDPLAVCRLLVTFPDDIPTHSKQQVFYFDKELLLRRLDYTAEVVGSWARAAHFCESYRTFGGIKVPTHRRVLPMLFGNRPLPGPTLVSIHVHDIRPAEATLAPS